MQKKDNAGMTSVIAGIINCFGNLLVRLIFRLVRLPQSLFLSDQRLARLLVRQPHVQPFSLACPDPWRHHWEQEKDFAAF
ncbi:MAG: hypothetical protein EOO09_22215 [Chitinophagaceae bacterium]|nr:MAG: hypothetical protein EOO09_22215 [Chitinophagaceae bacterium]